MITGLKGTKHNYGKFENRQCKSCSEDFVPYHPRQRYCSEDCQRVAARHNTRKWNDRYPHKARQYYLKGSYNLSPDEYQRLFNYQDGVCAICHSEAKLHVDHCHKTGEIRGLLCSNCNTALGLLKDSTRRISNALKYLAYGSSTAQDITKEVQ